jgi:hypothetical protein
MPFGKHVYSFNFFKISAKAGLVIKMPAVTLIIVVNAKPFNNPAPAQNKGSIAATIVKNAPKIINKALFILSEMLTLTLETDSSMITI